MTNILSIVGDIVNVARSTEAGAPYHYERAEFETFSGALEWLKDWHAEDGHCIWHSGDEQRRHLARHWLWMRWLFGREIRRREALGHEQRLYAPGRLGSGDTSAESGGAR